MQTGLDVAGVLPGTGAPFDGANALISLARGDPAGAALAAAAMIPGVGRGATSATWAAQYGDEALELPLASEGMVRLYRAVSQAEYHDIMQSGVLREIAQSVSGKYFAVEAGHAVTWGQRLYRDADYRVIAIDVPAPVVAAFEMYWTKLDGIGLAYVARIDQLKRYIIVGEVTHGR